MAIVPKPPENSLGRRIATGVVVLAVAMLMWPFAQRQGALPVATWASPDGAHEVIAYEMPVLWGDKGKGFVRLVEMAGGNAQQQSDVPDVRAITGVTWDAEGAAVAGLGRMDFPKPEAEPKPEGDAATAQ